MRNQNDSTGLLERSFSRMNQFFTESTGKRVITYKSVAVPHQLVIMSSSRVMTLDGVAID